MMWDWGNGGWGNGGWDWGEWLPMVLMIFAFLAIVVWVVVMFSRTGTQRSQPHDLADHSNEAKRILDERFARGEIEEDEYRKRAAVLREHK